MTTTVQQREMAKKRYQRRQADLRRDVDKLLQLVTELKQYAGKNNGNTLSLQSCANRGRKCT